MYNNALQDFFTDIPQGNAMKLHSGERSQVSTVSAYFDAYVAANVYIGRRCECMPGTDVPDGSRPAAGIDPTWEVVRADHRSRVPNQDDDDETERWDGPARWRESWERWDEDEHGEHLKDGRWLHDDDWRENEEENGCEQKAGIVAEAEGEATLQKRGDEVEVSQVAG